MKMTNTDGIEGMIDWLFMVIGVIALIAFLTGIGVGYALFYPDI